MKCSLNLSFEVDPTVLEVDLVNLLVSLSLLTFVYVTIFQLNIMNLWACFQNKQEYIDTKWSRN